MNESDKKHNNDSLYFKDWTTKKLKQEASINHHLISVVGCYGMGDIKEQAGIITELEKRGIVGELQLTF